MALPLTDEPVGTAAGLPASVRLRPFAGDSDLPAFVDLFRAANQVDRIEERTTLEGMRNWVGHPSRTFDAGHDVVVASVDGQPIAYGWTSWVDTTDGVREYMTRG